MARRIWTCWLLLAVLAGCAQGRSTEVLDGGKAIAPPEDVADWIATPPVMQAVAAARVYWSAQQPGYPEDVRVLSTTTGSFTRPGAAQRVILFRMSLAPRGFPKKGLAVLEGGRLVRNIAAVLLAEEVEALRDFEGEGRDALALEGGFGMGGQYSRGVTVAAFGDAGFVDLGHVSVYESICGMDPAAPGPTSARISVVPGAGLMIEHFSQPTCQSQAWESLGPPEPLLLEPSQGTSFEEIPLR